MVKIVCELLENELKALEHIDLWRKREIINQLIRNLHDKVIWLQLPESFTFSVSYAM